MCWTDKKAMQTILQLRDEFNIRLVIETGTFRGVNTEVYAHYFEQVYSVEKVKTYLDEAYHRLSKYPNVHLFYKDSWQLLARFKHDYQEQKAEEMVFVYLDAHFYDPQAREKWVVKNELRALASDGGFQNCIICIHDFDNGELGHLCYDGEHMGWNVVGEWMQKINPDFHYYTNTKEQCEIYNMDTVSDLPIPITPDIIDTMQFVNSSDQKRYRGILYAVPTALDLNKYQLREYVPG